MKQPFKLAHPQVYEIIDHLYDVIWQHVKIRRHGIFEPSWGSIYHLDMDEHKVE